MECPACHSPRLRRSRARTRRERRLRFFLPVRYYRCRDCGRRFLRVTLRAVGEAVGRYAVLAVVSILAWRAFRSIFALLLRY